MQFNRRTAKIFAFSAGNISKYKFLIGKDVLPPKDLQEEAATIKGCKYFLLVKELQKRTSVAENSPKVLIRI